MGNNKPRTIDEFFIGRFLKLEEENKVLEERQEKLLEINNNLGDERDEYKNKYNELIVKLKEDFKIVLRYSNAFEGEKVISADNIIFEQHLKEKFDFYKNLFNLKEGEEDNEQ